MSVHEGNQIYIQSNRPLAGNWDSAHTTVGGGVAIFHLASSRVVLCYHSVDRYWFLPKGRRDASENTAAGAEREGFEEVQLAYLFLHSEVQLLMCREEQVGLPQPRPSSSNTYSTAESP